MIYYQAEIRLLVCVGVGLVKESDNVTVGQISSERLQIIEGDVKPAIGALSRGAVLLVQLLNGHR